MTKKPAKPIVYAFIDSENLHRGVQSQGWNLDYKKFRLYLKNKYDVEKAVMFIGSMNEQQALYDSLTRDGYEIVFKPAIHYFENGQKKIKGNVDAELVLHAAAVEFANYDEAVIISGDGDFYCLVEFLVQHNRLRKILTPNRNFSKLLRKWTRYISSVSDFRDALEYKKANKKSGSAVGRNLRPARNGYTKSSVANPRAKVKRPAKKNGQRKDSK
jgi:uncharacterized LabA/DUF88 family protein